MKNPLFAVRVSTYRRPKGTYHLLHRCLKSILLQTYTKWKIFLVGDCYQPQSEFDELASIIPQDKLYKYNLSESPERKKYTGNDLWKVAGCAASKHGLKKIQEEKLIHVPLDDDDYWSPSHLSELAYGYENFPEAVFIYTQSTYKNSVLPSDIPAIYYNNISPRAYSLIHSSVSWDTVRLPLMYKNIIEEGGNYVAGDAEMWDRIRDYCHEKGLKTLYIPKLTVHHDCEQGNPPQQPSLL